MKLYEIKTYDNAGNFKKQINPRNITSKVEFSENINGTQGSLTLSVVGELEDYKESDIIEVREMEEGSTPIDYRWDDLGNQTWDDLGDQTWDDFFINNIIPSYTGIIERIGIEEYEDKEVLNIVIFGIGTSLNAIIYKDGTNLTFNKNTAPETIIKDIVDYFNTQYGTLPGDTQNIGTSLFFYDTESIPATALSINRNFDKINCYSAIESICDELGFYFFIEPTGRVNFRETAENKRYTFRREIIKISRNTKKDKLVNRYFLEKSGNNVETYNNTTSQTEYNLKELYEAKTDINSTATQDEVGEKKVEEYGNPRVETEVLIKPQKGNSVYPGMTLTTQNTKNTIENQKITKIDKRESAWTLYLGDYTSIGKVF